MTNIVLGEEFKRQFRRLNKKYRSLPTDFRAFKESLQENPQQGEDLGQGIRKVRMAIASKGKGKSGGARIITFNVQQDAEDINITLLTIYDKSEIENVTDSFIQSLLNILINQK